MMDLPNLKEESMMKIQNVDLHDDPIAHREGYSLCGSTGKKREWINEP